jgi:hypothetical protein
MIITVNNWFTTTDISIYQADIDPNGKWNFFPQPRLDLKGGQSAQVEVQYKGIRVTWWTTVTIEKEFGYVLVHNNLPDLTVLDVFDISAGLMPHASYASWRELYISH